MTSPPKKPISLHKKTLKWCAQLLRDAAEEAGTWSQPRTSFDSNSIASREECLGRAIMLPRLLDEIERLKKKAGEG